jgi:hypothetical protein
MWYGYSCFNCKARSPSAATERDCEIEAANSGLVLGHLDGQAHYSCAECMELIFDPLPLKTTSAKGE